MSFVVVVLLVLTSRFVNRKMEELDALKIEIEALKAEVGEDDAKGPGEVCR